MEEKELIYLAGFFDGEGNIDIFHAVPNDNGRREQYGLSVKCGQKDVAALAPLLEFGGSLYSRSGSFNPTPDSYKQWHIHGKKASSFLEAILPYLRLKKDEAEIAIRFQVVTETGYYSDPEVQQERFLEMLDSDASISFSNRSEKLTEQKKVYDEFRALKASQTARAG